MQPILLPLLCAKMKKYVECDYRYLHGLSLLIVSFPQLFAHFVREDKESNGTLCYNDTRNESRLSAYDFLTEELL